MKNATSAVAAPGAARPQDLNEAMRALRDRDALKHRELVAMLSGMSTVRKYVEANRGDLDGRRGGSELDALPSS